MSPSPAHADRTHGAAQAAVLGGFGEATRSWFSGAFAEPTAAQLGAWEAVPAGQHALVVAPTGSGKTLAAFLWAIDRLFREPPPKPALRCRVLYVSPLKALAADVQRNLRAPLVGIRQAAARLGISVPDVEVGMRTGDTPAKDRRAFGTTPPDILVTTPESLFLILTSKARTGLLGVETVIVDEIHAVAGTKRGAHLALSLERLDELLVAGGSRPAQRIGLSATVQPVEAVAEFLGGSRSIAESGREVAVVQPPASKEWQLDVVVPVPDLTNLDGAAELAEPDLAPPSLDLTGPATENEFGPSGVVEPVETTPLGSFNPQKDTAPPPNLDLTGPATGQPRRASIWPHVEEQIVDLIAAHRSTLVFTNSRRQAERLTARLNEIWAQRHGALPPDPGSAWSAQMPGQSGMAVGRDLDAPILARAHHGSMSRAERARTETELKQGVLPAVVATSSLELGIDMGAVDLVIQVGAPTSVASGLQRIGRAGHQVGAVSKGVVFPTHRGDLVQTTVVTRRMRAGAIEPVHNLENPLDVLAQQVVAAVAMDDWLADDLYALVRRAQPYRHLGEGTWLAVLDMLAGRYPSEEFSELRARLVWDRVTGLLSARPGAQHLAVTSGGTIPDRGLYGVFLAGAADAAAVDGTSGQRGGKRVGELDEEMVYESRVGDTFTLGSSTWRIEDITPHQVLVSPAPGLPGRLPFWRGDGIGRPYQLGQAVGEFVRELDRSIVADSEAAANELVAEGLDAWATDNLIGYLNEQRAATSRVPDDRTIVVERFRDELGDWRIVIHSPFGAQVHAPWALVLAGRLRERLGVDVSAMHADDGIVLRLPDTGASWEDVDIFGAAWADGEADIPQPDAADTPTPRHPAQGSGRSPRAEAAGSLHGGRRSISSFSGYWDGARANSSPASGTDITADDILIDPDDVAAAVQAELGSSVLFAARFREAAARALLLPRRRPGQRQPLWQQRHRSAQLLAVASAYPQFPITLEAARESLQDAFDVAGLAEVMRGLTSGRIQLLDVTTPSPSPFAHTLLFGYTAQFLYDGDAPLAERRAAALSLDPDLLAELLGTDGTPAIADLLDVDVVAQTEAELQFLAPERQAKDVEALWDVLRRTGPHPLAALRERTREEVRPEVETWLADLVAARRVLEVRIADEPQWAVIEDAGRLQDALGVALPIGVPEVFTEVQPDPLGDLVRRHVRTHAGSNAAVIAGRFGLGVAVVVQALERLAEAGAVVRGALRPAALGGTGDDWLDPDVLRTLRRRSLAALRAEVEPVPPGALGLFLPRWQHVGQLDWAGVDSVGAAANADRGALARRDDQRERGLEGLLRVIDQLSGVAVPASALETLILPSRVADYRPEVLDQLMASGEVLWAGHARLPGASGTTSDGWISLHLADGAELTLPLPIGPSVETSSVECAAANGVYRDHESSEEVSGPTNSSDPQTNDLATRLIDALTGSGGFFLPQLAERVGASQSATLAALWDLVWEGLVTNDSIAPLRALLGHRGGAHRAPKASARARPMRFGRRFAELRMNAAAGTDPTASASAVNLATGVGRWSLLPCPEPNPTVRAHAASEVLLNRYGLLTSAVANAEGIGGQYGGIYRVLSELENRGEVRRGYFVERLGGAQFAVPSAVDELRTAAQDRATALEAEPSTDGVGGDSTRVRQPTAGRAGGKHSVLLLAATDPANPYGAALPWPAVEAGHRPGRKAGAIVILVDGDLALYVERGGRSLLGFGGGEVLALAASELARYATHLAANRTRSTDGLTIAKINGTPALDAVGTARNRDSSGRSEPPSGDTPGLAASDAVAAALLAAGFAVTPRGLRVHATPRSPKPSSGPLSNDPVQRISRPKRGHSSSPPNPF